MRALSARLLVLLPALLALTVLVFWRLQGANPEDEAPLFFNPAPRDVRSRALELLGRVAEEGAEGPAAVELQELGGAALPHVVPALDSLAPGPRAVVARALLPVAVRAGWRSADEARPSDEEALGFWSRAWKDRAADLRPRVAERAVARLSERALSLRRDDVTALDTLALPPLFDALRRAHRTDDVPRMRRLLRMIAEIRGGPPPPPATEPAAVARAAEQALVWWVGVRPRYRTLDGAERALAVLTDTRFARWLEVQAITRLGAAPASRGRLLDEAVRRGAFTTSALLGGMLAGLLLALGLGSAAVRVGRAREATVAAPLLPLLGAAAALAGTPRDVWGAGAVVALGVAGGLLAAGAPNLAEVHRDPVALTQRAFGFSELRVLGASVGRSTAAWWAALVGEVPLASTLLFVAEVRGTLPGLGPATLDAVTEGNVAWVVVSGAVGALSLALCQLLRDVAVERSHPGLRGAFHRRERWEP